MIWTGFSGEQCGPWTFLSSEQHGPLLYMYLILFEKNGLVLKDVWDTASSFTNQVLLLIICLIKIAFKIFKSPESLRWPRAMDWPSQSSVCSVCSQLTSYPSKILGQSLPNLICRICRGRWPDSVNFITAYPKGP